MATSQTERDKRYIHVFRGKDGQWYFSFVADNGERIAQSEGYTNSHDLYNMLGKYFPDWRRLEVRGENE